MAGRRTRFARTPFLNQGLSDNTITVWHRGALRAIPSGPTVASDGTLLSTHKHTAVAATPYAVVAADDVIGVNTTTTAIAVNLPAAAATNKGRTLLVSDEGGNAATNAITLTASTGQTINGATTYVLNIARGAVGIYSNGAAWFIAYKTAAAGGGGAAADDANTILHMSTFA